MRVMLLTADYPPHVWSGIGVAVQHQMRALRELGVEVSVLVARQDPARRFRAGVEPDGIQVRSLDGARFPLDPRRFDRVHLHSLPLAELAFELGRRFGLPFVYTAHALVHLESKASPRVAFWSAVQRRVFEQSERVIFLSEVERAAALERAPELRSRSVVIPNGVPAPPAGPSRASLAGPLVYAGRFAESKGLELLGQAIGRVFAVHPTARLVLAGGHGDAQGSSAVSRMRRAHPERCTVAGWLGREALGELVATASLLLVPSVYEPFGLVALEAMALGTPVLASAVGGLRELVGPRSGGRLVAHHDPELWAQATLELLADSSEHERLRRQGPSHVRARFASDALARRVVEEAYGA